MQFDASVFLLRIEEIKAAIKELYEETAILSRGLTLLRQPVSAGQSRELRYLEAMDAAINRMILSQGRLLDAVSKHLPAADKLAPAPARTPLEALGNAATTLALIRNAMDMLANDREGIKNLAPWQRELFIKAYGHIAGVVEALCATHQELRNEKTLPSGYPGGQRNRPPG